MSVMVSAYEDALAANRSTELYISIDMIPNLFSRAFLGGL
jgi:hypothetical protein